MKINVTSLERAFELAATGDYTNVDRLVSQLHNEGYVTAQVRGRMLRAQLLDLMRNAGSLKTTQKKLANERLWPPPHGER